MARAAQIIPKPSLIFCQDEPPCYDYISYGRAFISYAWYKPLLVGALTAVFMLLFQMVLLVVALIWAGPDVLGVLFPGSGIDVTTGPGAILSLGTIAVLLPALALSARIVGDRPFSSYSSSRGGWNWVLFAKCMALALPVVAAPMVANTLLDPDVLFLGVRFDAAGLLLCLVLGPLQCVAEEYVFRGYCMQTLGGWFRVPWVVIAIQVLPFTLGHSYNFAGLCSVAAAGACFGALAWYTRGLEASSAAHISYNMSLFMMEGLGFASTRTSTDLGTVALIVLVEVLFAAAVMLCGTRFGWFAAKGDGTAAHNARAAEELFQQQMAAQWAFQQQMRAQAYGYPAYPSPYGQPGYPGYMPQYPVYAPANAQYPVQMPQYPTYAPQSQAQYHVYSPYQAQYPVQMPASQGQPQAMRPQYPAYTQTYPQYPVYGTPQTMPYPTAACPQGAYPNPGYPQAPAYPQMPYQEPVQEGQPYPSPAPPQPPRRFQAPARETRDELPSPLPSRRGASGLPAGEGTSDVPVPPWARGRR